MRPAHQLLTLFVLFTAVAGCGGPAPKKVATLSGHQAKVTAAAFAPDGRILASGDEGGTLKLWDYAAGTELASVDTKVAPEDPEPRIEFIAFSPDSNRMAVERRRPHTYSVHPNQLADDLELWQVKPLRKLQTFDTQAMAFCFSPDGKSLLIGTLDGLLEWDINQSKSVGEWQIGHSPQSLAVAPDGSWAAVGTIPDMNDKSKSRILVWIDLKHGAPIRTLPGGHDIVGTHLKISADGKTVWHAPGDGQIQQVDTETWTIERSIKLRNEAGAVFAQGSDWYASLYDEVGMLSGHREISFGELPSGATYRLSDNSLPSYLTFALSNDGRIFALRHGQSVDIWQRP
jgi:WD40 repeat protein